MRTNVLLPIAAFASGLAVPMLLTGGCPTTDTQLPSDIVGDATAGQQEFSDRCANCHTKSSVAGARNQISNNLGSLGFAMSGITLTDQEIADLRAYLAQ